MQVRSLKNREKDERNHQRTEQADRAKDSPPYHPLRNGRCERRSTACEKEARENFANEDEVLRNCAHSFRSLERNEEQWQRACEQCSQREICEAHTTHARKIVGDRRILGNRATPAEKRESGKLNRGGKRDE